MSPNRLIYVAKTRMFQVNSCKLHTVFITLLFISIVSFTFYILGVVHAENNNSYRKETCLLS